MKEVAELTTERLIGKYKGSDGGPLLVAAAAVHGNEHAGVHALKRVFRYLETHEIEFKGTLIGLVGNMAAMQQGQRYLDFDMNRMWTKDHIYRISNLPDDVLKIEDREQKEFIRYMREALEEDFSQFLFMDLHTTSAFGGLFSIANELTKSIDYATDLHVPVIRNVCNVLKGTTLQYLQDQGLPAIGFEAGQHDDPESVETMIAAICLTLESLGCLNTRDINNFEPFRQRLLDFAKGRPAVVEFHYRHKVEEDDEFLMMPGFSNFDPVEKGQLLAEDRHGKIYAPESGLILMPLYQKRGSDGFFIAREVE